MLNKGTASKVFYKFNFHKIIILILILICILCLFYYFKPQKYVISPIVSQMLFGYSEDDEIDISEQISYSLGNRASKTACYDKSGNTVFLANRSELIKCKNKCKLAYDTLDYRDFVTMSSDCQTITIKDSDNLGLCIVKSELVFQYCILKQILDNISSKDIKIQVIIFDELNNKTVCGIKWPEQDPLIAFNDYQDLIDNTN